MTKRDMGGWSGIDVSARERVCCCCRQVSGPSHAKAQAGLHCGAVVHDVGGQQHAAWPVVHMIPSIQVCGPLRLHTIISSSAEARLFPLRVRIADRLIWQVGEDLPVP